MTKSVSSQAYIFNRKPLLFATSIVCMYSILIRQNAPTCECVAQYEDSQPYWIWRNSAKNEFFWVPKLRSICKSSRFALFWYIYFKLNLADFAPKFILLNRNWIIANILKSMYSINIGIFYCNTAVQAPLYALQYKFCLYPHWKNRYSSTRRLSTKAHTLQSCSHKLKIAPSKKRAGLTQFEFTIEHRRAAIPPPVLFLDVMPTIALRLFPQICTFFDPHILLSRAVSSYFPSCLNIRVQHW